MSEPGKTEKKIISHFLHKVLQAVLTSRIPHLSRPRHPRNPDRERDRDKWFSLALGDLPSALDTHAFLHDLHPSPADPLVIDIILSPRDPASPEAVIERWTAACDPAPSPAAVGAVGDGPSSYRKAYRHCAVLIRSLCSLLRLLPAHRAFRMLSASNHSYNYDISYKVSSFAVPFTREEERELNLYSFVPVETQLGQLSLSVSYRPGLAGFDLELSSQAPPAIIADYVGSPAADPMRAFPDSLTDKGIRSTSYPLRAARPSPPPAMTRPHSWTSAPLAHHPLSASPGKTADLSTSPVDVYGNRASGRASGAHRRGSSFGFDEFRLSPPFSASPTPSPPAHWSNPMQSRLRSETAPVSIPQTGMGKILLHRSPNLSDPTRSLLPPLSPRSTRGEHSSQESPSGSRSFRKSEGSRVGDFYSNLQWYTTQKMGLKDGRDDSGRFSSVLSSGGSPRFGISRSSSRLSIQDDLDDGDFSCPFAVDDVDTSYSQARNLEGKLVSESSPTSTASHNTGAAVGALVKLLSSAPPLRQDHSSTSISSKSELGGEVGGSSFFVQRKTSDALEELRNYREMKDMLLSQSGAQLLDSINQTTK